MASSGLARLALKPTSRMSLNERFQQLRQKQTLQQNNASKSNKSAQNASRLELRQGSQKNRRLALQMANRPSVLAALKANQNTAPKSRPITQRLGIKRVFNKSIPTNQNRNQNKAGFRLNRNFNANRIGNNQHNMAIKANNRRKANNTNSQNTGVIVGVKRKGLQRNRLRRNVKQVSNATGFKGKRKVGQQMRNQNQAKGVVKKGFRINRNFNARTTQGKPMKRRNVKPNKDQLDKDLDAYMAKTKSHLDAELDAYMSQTN